MQDLTLSEAAVELGVSIDSINQWHKRGCKALDGRRLQYRMQKRTYANYATGGTSERHVRVIPGNIVERLKQRRVEQQIPAGRISQKEAIETYSGWLTKRNAYHWHLPIKKGASIKRRDRCPLGRPLTVERYRVQDGNRFVLRSFYLLSELEDIQKLLLDEIGTITENGVVYKTASRLARDNKVTVQGVESIWRWLKPSDRPKAISRKVLVRQRGKGRYFTRAKLWPEAAFQQALEIRAQPAPALMDRNGVSYVSVTEGARLVGCSRASIRHWCRKFCPLLGRRMCPWRPQRQHVPCKGNKSGPPLMYVLLADVEAITTGWRSAIKAGWRGKGVIPKAILKAIASSPARKGGANGDSSPHLESINVKEGVVDERWIKTIEQLNGQLAGIRNGLADGADLLRAQMHVKALCDDVTHVSNIIGKEPGKLLCQGWADTDVVKRGAFDGLPGKAGMPEVQANRLYKAFVALAEFLKDGTNDYDRRELAEKASKAINGYLAEGRHLGDEVSFGVLEPQSIESSSPQANQNGKHSESKPKIKGNGVGVRANFEVVFSGKAPKPDVQDLALKLCENMNSPAPKTEWQVGRDFSKTRAGSILSQIRRLKRAGRISFRQKSPA